MQWLFLIVLRNIIIQFKVLTDAYVYVKIKFDNKFYLNYQQLITGNSQNRKSMRFH